MPTELAQSKKHLKQAAELGEANMKLEGFDPTSDALYRSLKEDILEGRIDFEEAVDSAILSLTRKSHTTAA